MKVFPDIYFSFPGSDFFIQEFVAAAKVIKQLEVIEQIGLIN
jgi:hypothetical protein